MSIEVVCAWVKLCDQMRRDMPQDRRQEFSTKMLDLMKTTDIVLNLNLFGESK